MKIECTLAEVDNTLYDLLDRIREPIRSYEVASTEESLGWGRSMVCERDYTIHIPELKLFFRYADEFEYNEETQKDECIEEILHFYKTGENEPIGGDYSDISTLAQWYIKENDLEINNPAELKCIIDMPYNVEL